MVIVWVAFLLVESAKVWPLLLHPEGTLSSQIKTRRLSISCPYSCWLGDAFEMQQVAAKPNYTSMVLTLSPIIFTLAGWPMRDRLHRSVGFPTASVGTVRLRRRQRNPPAAA